MRAPGFGPSRRHIVAARSHVCRPIAPLLFLLLLLLASPHFHQPTRAQAPQISPPPSAQTEASINLQSIWQHQEALAKECAQLEAVKVHQLRRVVQFDSVSPQVHLPNPLPVQLPAICLFLFGPPKLTSDQQAGEPQAKAVSPHLELVNWIYDPSELAGEFLSSEAAASNGSSSSSSSSGQSSWSSSPSISKRQANQLEADHETGSAAALSHLDQVALGDYLLNVDSGSLNAVSENEIADDSGSQSDKSKHQFHQQMDQLLADQRFKQAINASRAQLSRYLSPVILVPGLLGSRLQARVVSKQRRVNIFCTKQSDWQDVWLSLRVFLPVAVDCWLDNVRLEWDPASAWTRQPAGVETRVPDFGSIESVRHLDLKSPKLTKYYSQLIDRYHQLGYTPDLNLFAAPYDFRLAPQQLFDTYFTDLRHLIETAQLKSAAPASSLSSARTSPIGNKVTLVCHSMGCTHLLVFLRQQSPAWRQNRVRKLIALSSPWAGTVKALKALLVGDQLDLPLISAGKMRKLALNYPSIAYLLPQKQVFERPNRRLAEFGGPILVQTPEKIYRVGQMKELLVELGLERQWKWFESSSGLIRPLEPLPDVSVDCIHSANIPTPETMIFRNHSELPNGNYELINGEGDGTVNEQSLDVCADWARLLPDKVKHLVIMNTNHLGVLSHPTTLMHITDDVLADGKL